MPKATRKPSDDTEEHGSSAVTNPQEAQDHVMDLEALMKNMKEKIATGTMTDILKQTLKNIKTRLVSTFPSFDNADVDMVFNAIRDKELKVLSPRTEDTEVLLEELLPGDKVAPASSILREIQDADTLSTNDQELIAELFDILETAHDQLAMASRLIGRLARTLKLNQLMLVLKASVRPLIQLKTKAGLDIEATTSKPKDLPKEQATRIELLATPDRDTPPLKNEKVNSPTRLLAATYAFKIINTFSDGTTQQGLQERYQVKAKQLAACIRGKKYMGGTDRKRKRSRSDEGDPSPEKPSTSQLSNTVSVFFCFFFSHSPSRRKKSTR